MRKRGVIDAYGSGVLVLKVDLAHCVQSVHNGIHCNKYITNQAIYLSNENFRILCPLAARRQSQTPCAKI